MATTKDTCKVCGAPMESAVCHQCGWTPILFPARVPKAIRDFESERIEVAKMILKKNEELKKQEEEFQKQKRAYDNISSQLSEARKELTQTETALREAEVKAQNDSNKIEELKNNIEYSEKFVGKQDKEIKRLQARLAQIENESKAPAIDGFVRIINTLTELETVLPVFRGVNTYGFSEDMNDSNHHRINLHIRGFKKMDKLFSIEKNGKNGMVIRPISGIRMVCEGSEITQRGKTVEVHQPIFVDNMLKFIVSKF